MREFLEPEEQRWSAFDADLAEPVREIGRLVLVGGMCIGTLFTLFVVPSIYMLVARDHGAAREGEQAFLTGVPDE